MLTLVVVNTVDAARRVHEQLGGTIPRTLVHSRFRGLERDQLLGQLRAEPGPAGRIVVSTQVVEAGLDLDAAVLVTEAAPWPSMVQRAGRCNRQGRVADGELWWLPPERPEPYPPSDLEATASELAVLEGRAVTGEQLRDRTVAVTEPAVSVIRAPLRRATATYAEQREYMAPSLCIARTAAAAPPARQSGRRRRLG